MGSNSSSMKKMRKMSATLMQRKGETSGPRRVKELTGKRKSHKRSKGPAEHAKGMELSTQAFSFEPKDRALDPRQEELQEISTDPTASAAEVMRARVRSRRFDLNLHLEDDDAEEDYTDDEDTFGFR